jgi:hypothetical protein
MTEADQDAEVIKHLREQLQEAQKQNTEMTSLLRLGYEVYQMLMPGVKHISVPDYAALNTFGSRCEKMFGYAKDQNQNGGKDPDDGASAAGGDGVDGSSQ